MSDLLSFYVDNVQYLCRKFQINFEKYYIIYNSSIQLIGNYCFNINVHKQSLHPAHCCPDRLNSFKQSALTTFILNIDTNTGTDALDKYTAIQSFSK